MESNCFFLCGHEKLIFHHNPFCDENVVIRKLIRSEPMDLNGTKFFGPIRASIILET